MITVAIGYRIGIDAITYVVKLDEEAIAELIQTADRLEEESSARADNGT